MDARGRNTRWWLAVAYTLATVFASCAHVHDHGTGSEEADARCLASCRDSRLHLSGHQSPDLGHLSNDCLACQFRANHQTAPSLVPTRFDVRDTGAAAVADTGALLPPSVLRLSCRGPPRV